MEVDFEKFQAQANALGDWKDKSQKKEFFTILASLTAVYNGFEFKGEIAGAQTTTTGQYPQCVLDALKHICKDKFPTPEESAETHDEDYNIKPGYPAYSGYLSYVTSPSGISYMAERSNIYSLSMTMGIGNPEHVETTSEGVENLILASQEYLQKIENQSKGIDQTDTSSLVDTTNLEEN